MCRKTSSTHSSSPAQTSPPLRSPLTWSIVPWTSLSHPNIWVRSPPWAVIMCLFSLCYNFLFTSVCVSPDCKLGEVRDLGLFTFNSPMAWHIVGAQYIWNHQANKQEKEILCKNNSISKSIEAWLHTLHLGNSKLDSWYCTWWCGGSQINLEGMWHQVVKILKNKT